MENIAGAQIGSGLQLVNGVLSTTEGGGSGGDSNAITGITNVTSQNYAATQLVQSVIDNNINFYQIGGANGVNVFNDGSAIIVDGSNLIPPSPPSANNSGTGEGIYKYFINGYYDFKSLIAGSNITLSSDNDTITINSSGGTGGGLISDTYANIQTLVTNNQLVAGQHYLITNHQTKHVIPNTTEINTGSVEPLILLATSTNKFDNLAYSTVYPEDTIHFDFNSNLCEDNTTSRTGKIIYRKDRFNNSCHYDFRNVKFRRWSVDCSVSWSSGTVYTKDSLIKYNDIIYIVTKITTSGDVTTPYLDNLHYCQFLDLRPTSYWSWTNNKNNFEIAYIDKTNLTIGSYIDCYTFDNGYGNIIEGDINGVYDNEIKFYNSSIVNFNGDYNNNVFFNYTINSNVIGCNSYNNTIFEGFIFNNIGSNFYSNIIGPNFHSNKIGNYFNYNTVSNSFYSNTIGDNFQYNAMESGYNNIIHNNFAINKINYNFNFNIIENNFNYNIIGDGFNNNIIGNYFQYNTIGNDFYYNTIGNYSHDNIIGNNFTNNMLGNTFRNNTIGVFFCINTTGNEFNNNIIGNNFNNNTIGNSCGTNVIGNNTSSNTLGNYFVSNILEDGFQNNTVKDSVNVNFTSATYVYIPNYNKTIFRGNDGNFYLSYFDGTAMIYVTVNA